MKNKDSRPETAVELRSRAEGKARETAAVSWDNLDAFSPEEIQQTLHELQVHQIELEMQNEELRRAHTELAEARARYFDLYNLAPVGYCTVSEKGLILLTNLTAATLLGDTRDALLKQSIMRYILMEDQDIYYLHRKQLFETGEPQACELRMKKADGTAFWGHLESTTSQDAKGEPVHRVVLTDITQSKKAQEEIRKLNEELEQRVRDRTAQLETSNKDLDAFCYSISHDLRAPLRAVHGYTRILVETFGPGLDAEAQRLCTAISHNAQTMGKLIDNLLAFSRFGRTSMRLSPVDMGALAQSVFSELTTQEERERIDFKMSPLPQAQGDRALLRQVWINLISNALKFSTKKERSIIEVSVEPQGKEIVYSIRDNGVGFDMRYAEKLFVVFQRLHSAKEFEGTGVGLAIAQRIINRHGGRIWAEGETGKGAVFYFTI